MTCVIGLGIEDEGTLSNARRLVGGDEGDPYLSLAVCDRLNVAALGDLCAALANDLQAIRIAVSGIATFQGNAPVIYAAVLMTERLRLLHARVHSELPPHASRSTYEVGYWTPHITLKICAGHADAVATFAELLPEPIRGLYRATSLVVVSGPPPVIEQRYALLPAR